jgi:arginyl-tRNA synthetase
MPNPFADAARDVVAGTTGVPAAELKVEAPPRPELGDFAVGLFPAAKRLGKAPPVIAKEVAAAFTPGEFLATATATGPFVNFTVQRAAAFHWTITHAIAADLVPRQHGTGKTIVIDYSSPNISKHLAFHHIRSTSLGHSLAQIHRALGFRVVGINHLGDWGTTHGMVIAACKKWGTPEPLDVTALNDLYVRFNTAMKAEPALKDEARAWSRKLEEGDAEAHALWQRFRDVSWAEFQDVYEILGVEYDEVRGESAYEPDMPRIFQTLTARGLIKESQGAQVVELPGEDNPILLRTRDGTTLYATRDVASAEYRWDSYHFTRSLYVVDRGQSLHFRQLFKLLGMMGHTWASQCEHIPYGLVRIDKQKSATRLGNVVLMRDVFTIAQDMARKVIGEVNPNMAPELIPEVARKVGIGAIVFGNLAPQRDKDIDFDIEHAVSFEGDAGPYVQYSHARCASVARKAGETVTSIDGIDLSLLTHDLEWAIARRLLDFPEVVVRSSEACEPHVICHYLLQLSADFARWYTAGNTESSLRMLSDDTATRRARLALTAATQVTLRDGLDLLGIAAPDEM